MTAAAAACASAGISSLIWRARDRVPGLSDRQRWDRINHRGRHVDLAGGPAFALGAAAGILSAPGITAAHRKAGLTALLGSAAFGLIDDLADRSHAKGLAGHLRALAQGTPTTGSLKILGIGVTAVAAATAVSRDAGVRPRAGEVVLGAGLIAGCANLINLLDLRPGRALKAGILAAGIGGLPGGASGPSRSAQTCAGAVLGPSVALWRADLNEEAMLGDCGANALGALLGVLLLLRTAQRPAVVRGGILGAIVCVTVVSEKVSFTSVIEATPVLRHLDAWGRADMS